MRHAFEEIHNILNDSVLTFLHFDPPLYLRNSMLQTMQNTELFVVNAKSELETQFPLKKFN